MSKRGNVSCRFCGKPVSLNQQVRHMDLCLENPDVHTAILRHVQDTAIEIDGEKYFPSKKTYDRTKPDGIPASRTLLRRFGGSWDAVREKYGATMLALSSIETLSPGEWTPLAVAELQELQERYGGQLPQKRDARHAYDYLEYIRYVNAYGMHKFCEEHGLNYPAHQSKSRATPEWKALRTTQPPSAQALGKERDDYAESWGMPAKEGVRRWLDRSGQMCEQIVYMLV